MTDSASLEFHVRNNGMWISTRGKVHWHPTSDGASVCEMFTRSLQKDPIAELLESLRKNLPKQTAKNLDLLQYVKIIQKGETTLAEDRQILQALYLGYSKCLERVLEIIGEEKR